MSRRSCDAMDKGERDYQSEIRGNACSLGDAMLSDLPEAIPIIGNLIRIGFSIHNFIESSYPSVSEEEEKERINFATQLMATALPSFIPVRTIRYLKGKKEG
jgi:hypothetical protein